MEKVLIIMRGIPGAGKSTLAKKLVNEGIIHSTDTLIEATGDYLGFFKKLKETGNYAVFSKMHSENLRNAKKSINESISPVIIDNTNIKPADAKPYVEYAIKKGYSIQIEDVGTSNLTAEVLAERNTHGVPLDKIKSMIQSHKSIGALTTKKIMEAKDRRPSYVWSGVKLDEKSRGRLLAKIGYKVPLGWKIIAEHMTLAYGKTLKSINRDDLIDESMSLKITGFGFTDKAFAVLVEGFTDIITDRTPHITIAVNNKEGGKPVMSNDITKWTLFKDLNQSYITVTGKVTEIKK